MLDKKMAQNQTKFRPTICAIDEVDDPNLKMNETNKQQCDTGSETIPLTNSQLKLHLGGGVTIKKTDSKQNNCGDNGHQTATDQLTIPTSTPRSLNGIRAFSMPGRASIDAFMHWPNKIRILYITTMCLCALLLIIIILLIAFWPDVPFYLKAELCLTKQCVEASRQLLLWSNTSTNPCYNTYKWACGNFAQDYYDNDYAVIQKGEWDYKAFKEYKELNELNRFISMLPTTSLSYSVESLITSLYQSCREIDMLDKSQSDLLLRKAIKAVDGWQAFRDANRLQYWDYKKALVHLQAIYGVFPFYKVSVKNRFNKPHDYIITLSEGEISLPDEYFYNTNHNDEIIKNYKLLLRDFAINMGIVAREADLFADDIFHYEKRIVNHIASVKSSTNERRLNEIKTLAEIHATAPSLPIFETLQALFPHTKINEETEILIQDVEIFQELSTVLSTSDKKPINNFLIWSLARHLLPYLSKEYRKLMENFDNAIYGSPANYPRWMICSTIVKNWLPLAVDYLQQKPILLNRDRSHSMHNNVTLGNDELLKLMFYTLRNQLQNSVMKADWLHKNLRTYINDKLNTMRLQIGTPEEAFKNQTYIHHYYNELLLNNLYFVEHLESIWSFRKSRMEEKLKPLTIVDTIISEMYTSNHSPYIIYSHKLNMLIIPRSIMTSSYYDYRYPIAINFARIGSDILEELITSITTFIEQYQTENYNAQQDQQQHQQQQQHHYQEQQQQQQYINLPEMLDVQCLNDKLIYRSNFGPDVIDDDKNDDLNNLAQTAIKSLYRSLSAAKIAARALSSFITAIDNNKPILGASFDHDITYDSLYLRRRLRLPGLRSFSENELYTLSYMQKHCSIPIANNHYERIKPFAEQKLSEKCLFKASWDNVKFLPLSSGCSTHSNTNCQHIL